MTLKVPKDKKLLGWANEIIHDCEGSRGARIDMYAAWRQLYFTGSLESWAAPYNKLFPHIDTLGSYLYSPKQVRFLIEYDHTVDEDERAKADVASNYLSRQFAKRGFNFAVEQANNWALVKGSTFIKTIWGHGGMVPYVVEPEMMGVLREDIAGLENQEAFFHSMYLTPGQFERLIDDHPKKKQILDDVQPSDDQEVDPMRESMFKEIVVGPDNPITTGPPTGQTIGNVNWISAYNPFVPPQLAKQLIRIDELWVMDRVRQDWTTIQIAQKRAIIEGDIKHRNLCGIEHHQPFTQFCPNAVHGYFWGMSEITMLANLQMGINERIGEIDRIEKLQAHPPLSKIGGGSFAQAEYNTLMAPDGFFSESEPGAKMENMAPKLPDTAYADLDKRIGWFNDTSGLSPGLRGEGQEGVRAGGHAETLVRTGSARIVDRALKTESDLAELGDFMLRMEQVKSARPFPYGKDKEFLLDNLADDFLMTVDSHSASPAFSEEGKQIAFALFKAGAISKQDLIRLTHPPREDSLIAAADRRDEEQAKMFREHPELLRKQMSKRK